MYLYSRYPYLHQMSPDYSAQVKTMVDELIFHNWTYIAIITTEDTYGRIGLVNHNQTSFWLSNFAARKLNADCGKKYACFFQI